MDVNQIHIYSTKKIKVFLVFFCLLILVSCHQETKVPKLRIVYNNNQKATLIIFEGIDVEKNYKVRLQGSNNAIFGDIGSEYDEVTFKPIIPFTEGKTYEVYIEDVIYLTFDIPESENRIRPKLLEIHPRLDTLPENLLKMYLVFSKPMQQSQSTLDFIKVFNQTTGKEVDVFLPLENELWNADKTELTLWLDPGRIKKDLIPNQEKGIPIEKGNRYEMIIEKGLQDKEGIELARLYTKQFFVGERDEKSPNVKQWKITPPSYDTKESVGISFGESMDVMLIKESIQIIDKNQEEVSGEFLSSKKGTNTLFIPDNLWEKGKYTISISGFIEDLAGNNLNRLFDVDLEDKSQKVITSLKLLYFEVE